MEDSHIPVRQWIYAMYLMTVSRKSISSVQLAKELGITQKSAWHMEHRLRESCKTSGLLAGPCEADETYISCFQKPELPCLLMAAFGMVARAATALHNPQRVIGARRLPETLNGTEL
jgi:hypothetical protein